jgi:hypothetical protein
MPHYNRARLADITDQCLDPDKDYKKTGKDGFLVSPNVKSDSLLVDNKKKEKVVVQESLVNHVEHVSASASSNEQKFETEEVEEQLEIQHENLEIQDVEKENVDGFLVPSTAQKISDLTSEDQTTKEKSSKKKNKKKY